MYHPGFICAFGFQYQSHHWLPCDGQNYPVREYGALFGIIGTTYGGGDGLTFNVPDLTGRTDQNGNAIWYFICCHNDSTSMPGMMLLSGVNMALQYWYTCGNDSQQTFLDVSNTNFAQLLSLIQFSYGNIDNVMFGLPFITNIKDRKGTLVKELMAVMASNETTFCGCIMAFGSSSAPDANWLACNGQHISYADYPTLSSLIGTTYGSNSSGVNLPTMATTPDNNGNPIHYFICSTGLYPSPAEVSGK